MKTHSLYIIAVLLMFASCTKMNDNIKDYLDRGEINYLGRPGANFAQGGLNKIALNWIVDDDPRITGAIITYTDLKNVEQKIEVPIDRSTLTEIQGLGHLFTKVIEPIDEGTYVFKIQHTSSDKANQPSLYTELSGRVYGPVYLAALKTRGFIGQAVHLGNGTIMQWSSQDGQSCLVRYKNISGNETETTFTNFKEQVILTDYYGGNLYYEMTILSDPNAMEPFVVKDSVRVDEKTWPLNKNTPVVLGIADFDLGGQNHAYYDTDAGNNGGVAYRDGIGDADGGMVDLQNDPINIGWTNAGEWLNYTVTVEDDGIYLVDLNLSTNTGSPAVSFHVDGTDVTGPLPLPNSGGWGNYTWGFESAAPNGYAQAKIALNKGVHTITFYENSGGYNVRNIRFTYEQPLSNQVVFLKDKITVNRLATEKIGVIAPAGYTPEDIVWTNSNPAVAFAAGGVVRGLSAGDAKIIATVGGVSASIDVTVNEASDYTSSMIARFNDAMRKGMPTTGALVPGEMHFTPNGNNIALEGDTLRVPQGSNLFTVLPGFPLDDTEGASTKGRVNVYTMMFDFKVPDLSGYHCFMQSALANDNDGEFFMHRQNDSIRFGVGNGIGYTKLIKMYSGIWYRFVISIDMEHDVCRRYINGAPLLWRANDQSPYQDFSTIGTDAKFSLDPNGVILIGDNDGEDKEMFLRHIAIWPRALTPEEVAQLQADVPMP